MFICVRLYHDRKNLNVFQNSTATFKNADDRN